MLGFLLEVKNKCKNKDFIVLTDGLPCYRITCKRLGINHIHETFGKRSLKFNEEKKYLICLQEE